MAKRAKTDTGTYSDQDYGLPESREYSIASEQEARDSLAALDSHTCEEGGDCTHKMRVRNAVAKRYPHLVPSLTPDKAPSAAQPQSVGGGHGGDQSGGEPGVLTAAIDAPITLGDTLTEGPSRSRIVVAKLGKYQDKRYGNFQITREDYDGWQRNLSKSFNGRVPIDIDHAPEKGRGTEAAAWITNLDLDGDKVLADVEWTPLGERAVKERRYLYISPTFVQDWKDETGAKSGRALIGAALTNRPFLRKDMPALTLAEGDEAMEETTLAENLPRVLADVFSLYLTAHGFHWNCRGQDFAQYHELFGDIYDDVWTSADAWAENMRKLGLDAPFRMNDLIALRELDDPGPVASSPDVMARELLLANAQVLECLNEAFALATAENEQGIANYAAERIDQHQKWAWQLRASVESEAHMLEAPDTVEAFDSHERMTAHDNIAVAIGLSADADDQTVLDTVRTLASDTPEQAVILSAAALAELAADAAEGREARIALAEAEFRNHFDRALSEGRVTPAQEDVFRAIHEQDAELAAKTLDSLRPVVKTAATGDGTASVSEQAPEGVDADRFELHEAAKSLAASENIDYMIALDRLAKDQEFAAPTEDN